MTKRQKFFSAAGKFLKNVFTKNLSLKIVALVFALLLWGYVLSEVKPKYVKRVYDVEIELRGEDDLKQKGWVVVDDEPFVTDVNIEAGIDKHSMLDSSRVKCYVDLDKIQLTDQDPDRKTVTLDVLTTIPEYGVLKSTSVEQVDITIERTWTGGKLTATVRTENSLPSIVKADDAAPEYFECIAPKTVVVPALSGLKSEIEQIVRAEVTIDLSAFEDMDLSKIPGVYSLNLPVVFYDVDGNQIDTATTRDVKVTVDGIEIRRYKEVPIELNLAVPDTFDSNLYECECEIADDTEQTVRIYGEAQDLARVKLVRTERIIPNQEEGEESLTVKIIIPPKVDSDNTDVTVSLTVKKRMSDEISYEIPVSYTGVASDLKLTESPEYITVRVSGQVEPMMRFEAKWLSAVADLTGRGEGTHKVLFELVFKGIDLHVSDYRIVEPEDGSEPEIRITYIAKDGTTYLFVLPQKDVTVRLEKTNNGTADN